tara:strand:- start:167 stop:811 length:645 start_codon:yes stop_codon:yes gene_type:complete
LIKKFSKNLVWLVFLLIINSCGYKVKENSQYFCEKLNLTCNTNEKLVVFYTSKGIIKVQLFSESNPVTVANFISNVKTNIYSNKNFYRIINYSSNKLIHNGLNKINNFDQFDLTGITNENTIPLEIKLINKEPIYQQSIINPLKIKNLEHKFEKGSLSMVKVNKNRSSSTEFFFSLNNLPEFDGRYSIFGKVISGAEILKMINRNDLIKKIELY